MKQQRHWMERLTDGLDLTGEVSIHPVVELTGDRRVLIEHHLGILQYQQDRICVKLNFGTVLICGCGMEIARMSKEQLVIAGRIESVTLQRRNG